ncbi:Uncharacterized protein dnm_053510 [Desulfonema magnum]|uniref:Uncharacterized protein n=1 Tax=Desulfonema magnum TaxID=45655 RepID=A0A975BPL2_9BACT|nr:Uncharacterized protein dnm_053510 [Desulfonema magnum]
MYEKFLLKYLHAAKLFYLFRESSISVDRKVSGLCAAWQRNPAFFPRTEDSPRGKKPGFFPVRRVCPATARKLFDLLNIEKQNSRF